MVSDCQNVTLSLVSFCVSFYFNVFCCLFVCLFGISQFSFDKQCALEFPFFFSFLFFPVEHRAWLCCHSVTGSCRVSNQS